MEKCSRRRDLIASCEADWMENLRWANTKPSMHFRETNTEPPMHFRKANKDSSMHFRKANTEFLILVLLPTLLTISLSTLLLVLPSFILTSVLICYTMIKAM